MKKGVKTTEFWMSLAGIASLVLSQKYGVQIPPEMLATAITAIVGVYTSSRAWVKGKKEG